MISDRTPLFPPKIKPVVGYDSRPLWSVVIPTYNCSNFLPQTLNSVLAQARSLDEMQIMVVDDCSTDGEVQPIVERVGKGRVDFFRQNENVGSLRNFETCINKSRGQWIHILHGDDQVKPGFYSEIENLFNQYPTVGAAVTGLSAIDENGAVLFHYGRVQSHLGAIENWLQKISARQFFESCAIVVKRTVYEELGGFYGVHYGEDWEMWVRIASKYPVAYSPQLLALYRLHGNNISTRAFSTGQNFKDIQTVINIIQKYLPVEKRKEAKNMAKKHFSLYFTNNAQNIYKNHGDPTVALKQATGALSLHFNKSTLVSLLKLYMKILLRYQKRL
ncbi:MAG: glycosyl transferase family 2 [Mucilaginibacter sp.]|nr:glycosyl transferase family 2 [Mucilaginibacter sp.]